MVGELESISIKIPPPGPFVPYPVRNGHKFTHESNKPHACHFCDKSYSDARSLRRHYENMHPKEYKRWQALSRAASDGDTSAIAAVAVALLSDSAGATDVMHSTDSSPALLLNSLSTSVDKMLIADANRGGNPNTTTGSNTHGAFTGAPGFADVGGEFLCCWSCFVPYR